MLRTPLTIILAALAPLVALPAESDEKGTASFRFISLAPTGELCAKVSKEKHERLNIGIGFIGAPVRLPLTASVELLRNEAPALGDPAKPGPPVGAFSPLNAPRQLVFLAPESGKPIRGYAMPDTATGIPYGRTLVMNTTKAPVIFSLNNDRVTVPPQRSALCPVLKETNPATKDIRIRAITTGPEGERLVYASIWPAGGDAVRTIVFILEGSDGLVEVRPVTDVDTPALREAPSDKKTKKPGATR